MKKIYHVVFTSHNAVLFRNETDYLIAINLLALTAYKYDSRILAYSFMSNHVHFIVESCNLKSFMQSYRTSLSMIYNTKYKSSGRVGDRGYFRIELDSPIHIVVAVSYVLRNPVHHLVTETPFDYPFCSARYYFNKDIFTKYDKQIKCNMTKRNLLEMFHSHKTLSESFLVNLSGIILPETFLEIKAIEHYYQSARSYLYYMNCPSTEEWQEIQKSDDGNPIRLNEVERGTSFSMDKLLSVAKQKFRLKPIDDLALCKIIDEKIVRRYKVDTFNDLTTAQKKAIGNYLFSTYRASKSQVLRCLCICE